jgi:hypothetical protein
MTWAQQPSELGEQWWACQDLNLGPHPYQQNRGNRCAEARFPRWRSTVGAEVMCSHRVQLCALVLSPELSRCYTSGNLDQAAHA